MTTTRTSDSDSRVPSPEAIRVALIELLLPDPRHEVASPTTLAAIAQTRRELTEFYTDARTNPLHPLAPASLRHAALARALGTIGLALLDAHHHRPHTECLHAGLTDLAAITLAWLDTLPTPHPHTAPEDNRPNPELNDDDAYSGDGYEDASPF